MERKDRACEQGYRQQTPHGRQTHTAPSPTAFQADFWQGQLGTGDTTTAQLPRHLSNPRGQITHTHSILHRGRNWNTGQTSLISSAHTRKLPWEHPQRNIHDPWGQLPRLLLGSLHLTHLFSQTLVVFLRPLPELAGNRQCVRASPTRNTHTGTLLTTYLQ